MEFLAIAGEPPEGLLAALAMRGIAVALVACDPHPPAGARIALADLDADTEIAWLDRGIAVVPRNGPAVLAAARIAAMLRAPGPIAVGSLMVDPAARVATRAGRLLDLLPREFALLLHLARQAGRTVTQDELRAAVWGLRFHPGTNVVAVHVSRLRARLDRGSATPMLLTDRGVGYRLVAD